MSLARQIVTSDTITLPVYKDHAIADIFPLIEDGEFAKLKADVAAFGVREPIWLFDGKILDGRNRYRAAKETGVSAKFREFDGDAEKALEFVWSMNRTRRHLSASQSAMADAERNKLQNGYAALKAAAKEKQGARNDLKRNIPEQIPESSGPPAPKKGDGDTRKKRAQIAGTNEKYIDLADKLVEGRPDLAKEVKQGKKTLSQVSKELKREEAAKTGAHISAKNKELPAGERKYGVIYADPPWSFDTWSGEGKDRAAENHYPTMKQADIEALPVANLAADDCVLFMWAVMPQLPEALAVIKAWGFEFKTCAFVWVKQTKDEERFATGMGYWTRANAEICLLATRGKPQRLHADVHQVVASPRMEHSKKPDEIAKRIERLVSGPYIEMFARAPREGWDVWGNQAEAA